MKKVLFIDRDGTLIAEPADNQVDRLDKVRLMPGVIPALLALRDHGYRFVLISNQDGLGTDRFPREDFDLPHNWLMELLRDQGIRFDEELICPHLPEDRCSCRKPAPGLMLQWLQNPDWDRQASRVIGDRQTDMELAENTGLTGMLLGEWDWPGICRELTGRRRQAEVQRNTSETRITVGVDLDQSSSNEIHTGIGFFDHMLDALGRHSGITLQIRAEGDLHVDAHHTVEDVGLTLGAALRKALGDKVNIGRYGFSLPMDEAGADARLDLSGRAFFFWEGRLTTEKVGELPTEMVGHFFRSLCDALGANLHIRVYGENNHHMVEAAFKAVAKSLGQAVQRTAGTGLPSTKGAL